MDALSPVGGTGRERAWNLAVARGPRPSARLEAGESWEEAPATLGSQWSVFCFFSGTKEVRDGGA